MMMRKRRRKGTWVLAYVLATVAVWAAADLPGSPEPSRPSESSIVTAAPGDVVLLPCYSEGSVTPSRTHWMKDGSEARLSGGPGEGGGGGGGGPRVLVLGDGSLHFRRVAVGDEGVYLCEATLPGNMTWRARVLLQVASGPENVSLSIVPSAALPNGTLVTHRGSSVSFHCAASSYPSESLTWSFAGTPLAFAADAPWLDFRMKDIQPEAQGIYSCVANNTLTHDVANTSAQLLVYYVSARHPECSWLQSSDPTWVSFSCAWHGCYPDPELRWTQGGDGHGHVLASAVTSDLRVTLNRSLLAGGQMLRCAAQHSALAAGREAACSFTLEAPRPLASPLTWAQEGNSVTLACTEAASVPPANTTWSRGSEGSVLSPGPKYALSREGATYRLTIANVSRDDRGTYFCRSENALALRRAEVYLRVTAASDYTGVIVGVFVAALIVGLVAVVAKLLFANRHRVCLGRPFGSSEGNRGDLLSLVESDEEPIFPDVPRLPPVTDARPTTLVQIRLPSSEQDDTGNQDARDEPGRDLVTF